MERNSQCVRNQEQVVQLRRSNAGFDPDNRDAVEVGAFREPFLSHLGALTHLSDAQSDGPTALQHALGDRILGHPVNAQPYKIKSL